MAHFLGIFDVCKGSNGIDVFVIWVTHYFETIEYYEEAPDDIGDSDKDDDTNEGLLCIYISTKIIVLLNCKYSLGDLISSLCKF